jgi:hypothetical protein
VSASPEPCCYSTSPLQVLVSPLVIAGWCGLISQVGGAAAPVVLALHEYQITACM